MTRHQPPRLLSRPLVSRLLAIPFLMAVSLLTACNDQLVEPPCEPAEASYPDGLAGLYAVANMESTPASSRMEPTTEYFRITMDQGDGFRAFAREGANGKVDAPSLPVSEFFGSMGAIVCKASGRWFVGTRSVQGTWSLAEILVHGGGFFLMPLAFRRDELAKAGLGWTSRPDHSLAEILRSAGEDGAGFVSEDNGLLIDNRKVSLERVVAIARPFHVVQNYVRLPEDSTLRRRHGKGLTRWREIARPWSRWGGR